MRKQTKNEPGQGILARLRSFKRDAGGVAAIEFAMIVPLMITMFIGTIELSQAITVDRRVSQVASSTADLVARAKTMTVTEMDGVLEVVQQLLAPYSDTPLRLSVFAVGAAPAANSGDPPVTTICWVRNHNNGVGGHSSGDTYTLPTGLIEAGDSVIVTEVEYAYTPLIFSKFLPGTTTLTETFYLKPRLSAYVTYDNQGC